MSMGQPICSLCKRLQGDRQCEAFPVLIPNRIYFDSFNHRKPFPGDNGILFLFDEKKKKFESLLKNYTDITAQETKDEEVA